ncbi:hypothetical protein [Actinoplanes sp. ATCC 53533]|nr:hypothetical protein [Actinoplanes sp. ATCC 53533]
MTETDLGAMAGERPTSRPSRRHVRATDPARSPLRTARARNGR